ncbi:BamA/TamA family outer membrane protein [bacterium]|nr:BamA/TamA family outer membrane protein [bacterium]
MFNYCKKSSVFCAQSISLVLLSLYFSISAFPQSLESEVTENKKSFTFGVLPTVLYNSDVGFQYGALINLFWYGDGGERYPHFDNSFYMEFSRTTRGNQVLQAIWDARQLIPDARMLVDVQSVVSQANPFYGFNGYQSLYRSAIEDLDSPTYLSEMYYRFDQRSTQLKINLQKNIQKNTLRAMVEFAVRKVSTSAVDITHLNEGREEDEAYPDLPGLYQKMVDWNVIPADLSEGGTYALLRVGAVLDTRDVEANPNRGVFDEAILTVGPSFLGFDDTVLRIDLIHRHYLTLINDRLTFAYRLKYETTLAGVMPWYLVDGLGGGKTVRGLLYNRLRGNGLALTNVEFRWKVLKTVLFNQNIYVALNPFIDMGRVVDPYKLNLSGVPAAERSTLKHSDESWHVGYGIGARLAINENFIMAIDYGIAVDAQDGANGLYIDLNYLF